MQKDSYTPRPPPRLVVAARYHSYRARLVTGNLAAVGPAGHAEAADRLAADIRRTANILHKARHKASVVPRLKGTLKAALRLKVSEDQAAHHPRAIHNAAALLRNRAGRC